MIEFKIQKKLQSAAGEMLLDLDFEIKENEFVTLYGASGSGKTTTLRLLSGLTAANEGFIKVKDTIWLDSNSKVNLAPQKRKIAYVFQDYGLFPNMTVRENLNFALEKGQDKTIIEELLALMELEQLQHQKRHNYQADKNKESLWPELWFKNHKFYYWTNLCQP